MRELTARQQEILELIKQHISATGFPPTRAEIASTLGFRSPNAAEEHLKALARKGVIELTSGASRGIRLMHAPMQSNKPPVNGLPGKGLQSKGFSDAVHSITSAVQIALSLPLIGRVSAGSPILAQEHIDSHFAVDPTLFADAPDYLLRVRGLSMRDAGILDGDLLAVKKATDARNGQIIVARIGDDVTVKRLQRRAGHIELLAENPDYAPIIVTNPEQFALEGIGVGLIRGGKSF
jgi:repressor LexA